VVPCPGCSCHRGRIAYTQSSTNSNIDAACSLFYQAGQRLSSPNYVLFSVGAQHTFTPCRNYILQGPRVRCRMIECAVEGDLQRSGKLDQLVSLLDIYCAIGSQQTQDYPAYSERTRIGEVFTHHLKLRGGVEKIPSTRAEQHMNRQSTLLHSLANQAVTRSESTFAQRCAKFYTVCSARIRREASLNTLGTQFKHNTMHLEIHPLQAFSN
jgi:hypothetical protein